MCGINSLQRPLIPAECRHPVQVPVVDLMLQRGDDSIFPGEEIRPGEVDAGDRVVGDEEAVAGQVLHKELQFLQHL